MSDLLHSIAQNDTPASVDVPNNAYGLAMWVVGRWGGGMVIALAALWMMDRFYGDWTKQNDRVIELLQTRAKAEGELASAISTFAKVLEDVRAEARLAHRSNP